MKKTFALTLALVLAFCVATPALAYWSTAPAPPPNSGITLDIYLVDHSTVAGGLLDSLLTQPATTRTYSKNDTVAAVVTLGVPEGVGILGLGYTDLRLSGVNVSLNVPQNKLGESWNFDDVASADLTNSFPTGVLNPEYSEEIDFELNTISLSLNGWPGPASADENYRVLFFAMVTGDNASMNATLVNQWETSQTGTWMRYHSLENGSYTESIASANTQAGDYLNLENGYRVRLDITGQDSTTGAFTSNRYLIGAGNIHFRIYFNADWSAQSLEVHATDTPNEYYGNWFRVDVGNDGTLSYTLTQSGYVQDPVPGREPTEEELAILAERLAIFTGTLGLDYTNRGAIMSPAAWVEKFDTGATTIKKSVPIRPPTPDIPIIPPPPSIPLSPPVVTVPKHIITESPKVGDAMSIFGSMLLALAGAAGAAFKKKRE